MKSEKNKPKHNFLSMFVALTLLFLFSACGDSQDFSADATSDTGSISFKLTWQDSAEKHYFRQALSGDACIDYAIDTVNVDISDSSHTVVASGSWPCSAHEGTLDTVPVGSDMTMIIGGVVAGNVDWRGQSAAISIYKDRNTDVGTLVMHYVGDDEDAPMPNPATWASLPDGTGTDTITMTATTGSDVSGPVEYYFDETSGNPGGSDSGWQQSPSYTDTGLSADTQYTYRVQMRDARGNTGGWSTSESATTQPDGGDEDAPTPNPATWASLPDGTGTETIAMTATTGSDVSGPVEYYFDETSGNPGGSDSGWQQSASYTDTGLSADTQYTYRVQMRDALGNTGGWSTSESATTQPGGGDEDAPTPNPATWASLPDGTGTDTITMTATTGSDVSGPVEYYFDETSGNPGGSDSGWQQSASYTDTGLSADTQYTYRVQMRDALGNTGGWSTSESATTQPDNNVIIVRARGQTGTEHINLIVGGSAVANWTLSESYQDYTYSGSATGDIQVEFDNDLLYLFGRTVQVDYIQVNGETRQAEDMSYNTALFAHGRCGGGGFSELMHCNGVIDFGDVSGESTSLDSNPGDVDHILTVRARGITKGEHLIDDNLALNAATDTSYVSSFTILDAVNDGYIPSSSSDNSVGAYGNGDKWNHNKWNWVEYDFGATCQIYSTDVYWWDDGHAIEQPYAANIEYWDGSSWVNAGNIGVALNQWNTLDVEFSTSKIRINMISRRYTGILEWQVWGEEVVIDNGDILK